MHASKSPGFNRFKGLVHIRALPLIQFSYELPCVSAGHRLYLIPQRNLFGRNHFRCQKLTAYSPQEG